MLVETFSGRALVLALTGKTPTAAGSIVVVVAIVFVAICYWRFQRDLEEPPESPASDREETRGG